MAITEGTCGCGSSGCGTSGTDVTEADAAPCSCGCCGPQTPSKQDRITRLRAQRASIDEQLAELESA
jgi:hypothetical protein